MFPNDLNRDRHPLNTRVWGVYLGTMVMFAVAAALVTSRTLPFTAPLLCVGVVLAWLKRNGRHSLVPAIRGGNLVFVGFAVYSGLSALWAERPIVPLIHAAGAALCFASCGIVARAFLSEPRRNIFHIGEGLWMGLAAGLIYLLVEILSHQTLKLHMYNALGMGPGDLRPPAYFTWAGSRLVSIAPDDLKRCIAPVTLFLWPALLSIRGTAPWRHARWLMVALFGLAAAVVFCSTHSTSKGALIAGAVMFALAYFRRQWGERVMRFGWVATCLAVIPLALLLHRAQLHKATWVPPSMQHRITIWKFTAEQTLKAPVLGIGAGMMYEIYGSQLIEREPEGYDPRVPHAHNLYLQTWFELGVIGAALLTLMGLAIIERIRRLGPHMAPYAQATFSSAAIMASSSYGMWQGWFLIMYAFTVVLFAIAVRSAIHKERTPGLEHAFG